MSPRRGSAFLGWTRPRKGRRRRQVSWLGGSTLIPGLPETSFQWPFWGPLAAYSCGHSCGFSPRSLFSLREEGTVDCASIPAWAPAQRGWRRLGMSGISPNISAEKMQKC